MRLLHDEREWTYGLSAVALGMFDGVHLGHARLVEETNRLAREQGLSSAVLTFANHPLTVLRPGRVPSMLTTAEEKIERLAVLAPDALVMRPFDADFAALSAEEYIGRLVRTLCIREVVVGFNYTFGARGAGDPALLERLGTEHGFAVRVLEPVCWRGEPVSSSRVRAALSAGDLDAVRGMMGSAYCVRGTVEHGKQLGRTLGFPTANLALPAGKALPPFGVYAARVRVGEGCYPSVLNIGAHPTAPEGPPTIEIHLLDVELDLYGRPIEVFLEAGLRPEQRFADLDALRAQIALDAVRARAVLADGR